MSSPLARTLTVDKTAGATAPITVSRFGGGTGAVTVHWSTADSLAIAGTHYPASNGTLSWADGDMGDKTFTVPVTNTASPQQARQFYVNLNTPGNGVRLGVYSSISVLITDPTATLPGPWSQTLLGSVTYNYPAAFAEGVFGSTVIGGYYGNTDNGNFIYQPRTGDGCLTAYVYANSANGSWAALMGLMVRDTFTNTSSNMADTSPGGYGTNFSYRLNGAFSQSTTLTNIPAYTTPCWVRLARMGSTFIAQESKDGAAGTNAGQVALSSMPTTAYWGMFNYAPDSNIYTDYSAVFCLFQYSNVALGGLPAPATPTGLLIGGTATNGLTLQWNTDVFSAGYIIERRPEGGVFTQIANLTGTNTQTTQSFTDTGLNSDTSYQYCVLAYNTTGTSSTSSIATGATSNGTSATRPGFLTATPGTGGSINVAWSDNSSNETGFLLQRRAANGAWTLLQTLPANTTSAIDSTALPGVVYEYEICATSAGGNSSWATSVSLATNAADATVNNPVWSPDSVLFNQDTTAQGNSYVPTGFTYLTGSSALPFVTGQSLSTTIRINVSGWVGMKVTVGTNPIVVSQLGRWVLSGNTGTHTLKFVNAATGMDVPGGSCSIATSGAPVGFKYGALAAPITLAANTAYYLVSQEVSGGDKWYEANSTLTFDPSLATTQSVYTSNNGANWWLYYNSCSYGPLSFKIPAAIPFTTGHSMTALRNNLSGWMGMKITVGANSIQASQLGRWVVPGNSGTHPMKLVDASTGMDVAGASASVVTAGASSGQFQYTSLAAPITLAANTSYYLLSQETAGGDQWYDYATAASGATLGYQTWLLANSLPMDASGNGSATASPGNDGLPNLIKYALGLVPNVRGNGGHLSYGKCADIGSGNNYLSLTFLCPNPAPNDITYIVETSPDLSPGSWTTSGVVPVSNTSNGGFSTITVRNSTIMTGANKSFMRLRVTQP